MRVICSHFLRRHISINRRTITFYRLGCLSGKADEWGYTIYYKCVFTWYINRYVWCLRAVRFGVKRILTFIKMIWQDGETPKLSKLVISLESSRTCIDSSSSPEHITNSTNSYRSQIGLTSTCVKYSSRISDSPTTA